MERARGMCEEEFSWLVLMLMLVLEKVHVGVLTHALLEHAADETTRRRGAVLERRGGGVAVEAAHGDAEERAAPEELLVRVAEASALDQYILALLLPENNAWLVWLASWRGSPRCGEPG